MNREELFKQVSNAAVGRDESDIPIGDPYWKIRSNVINITKLDHNEMEPKKQVPIVVEVTEPIKIEKVSEVKIKPVSDTLSNLIK